MTNITETDITTLIKRAGGHLEFFTALVNQEVEKEHAKVSRETVADRQVGHLEAIESKDLAKLKEMKTAMKELVDSIVKDNSALDLELGEKLDEKQQFNLMKAYIAFQKVKEFGEVWNLTARQTVFNHVTTLNEELGVEYPEHAVGSIEVPKLGKKFCKEGGKRKDPHLDEEALRNALGDDLWNSVQVEKIIPARVEKSLSIEKLMKAVEDNPALLETVRDALVVGEFKSNSFIVRPLGKQAQTNDYSGS